MAKLRWKGNKIAASNKMAPVASKPENKAEEAPIKSIKVRKVYRGRIRGERFSKIFAKTLLPNVEVYNCAGVKFTMAYNMYANKHRIKGAFINIRDHSCLEDHWENEEYWRFLAELRCGDQVMVCAEELHKNDTTLFAHYLNTSGLAKEYKLFEWARNNLYIDLPVVHQEVKRICQLEEQLNDLKEELKRPREIEGYIDGNEDSEDETIIEDEVIDMF